MSDTPLRIATRASPLAMVQAKWVQAQLPDIKTELVPLTTQGDRHVNHILSAQGGDKGWFVKELEEALLQKKADIAVHCIKDMPMLMPDGLVMPIICERASAFDVLVGVDHPSHLPKGAVIGSSSPRREHQWLAMAPHTQVVPIRGSIQTRLQHLTDQKCQALILAQAGLMRLGLDDLPTFCFPPHEMLPAVGQGALGIQMRASDQHLPDQLRALHHAPSALCIEAERALIRHLQADCQTPVASYATLGEHDTITLWGRVGAHIEAQQTSSIAFIDDLARNVYLDLKAQGAHAFLEGL